MKKYVLFAFVALFFVSSSAWADTAYVKVTAEDETVSWIEIKGIIDGTNIEILYRDGWESAIDPRTTGSIDLNEVWSENDGSGIHYQVTCIGESAFMYCSSLTDVTIPKSVRSIEDYAFSDCSGLTSIVVESGNPVYDSRNNCNAIIETASNTLLAGCKNTIIPNSVTTIGEGAFYGCTGLTSVTIPNSVTNIGNNAFSYCNGLTSIDIQNSVISIGSGAFEGTGWYDNQPDGLVYAGKVAYKYKGTMPANTSITLIEGTKGIAGGAFSGCSGLTSVTIPNSVTSIGLDAFCECSGLTSVTIPNSVTTIGQGAFSGCTGLTSVTIPNSVTTIGESAFTGCI